MKSHILELVAAIEKIQTCQPKLDFSRIQNIKNDYANWVIPGRLMAGPSPVTMNNSAENLDNILQDGIDAFICLQDEAHQDDYKKLIVTTKHDHLLFIHIPIIDHNVPNHQMFVKSLAKIIYMLADGKNIYIHCHGGHGRTGLYVVALLAIIYPELRSKSTASYYVQSTHDMRRKQTKHFHGILPARIAENQCQQELLDDFFALLRFL